VRFFSACLFLKPEDLSQNVYVAEQRLSLFALIKCEHIALATLNIQRPLFFSDFKQNPTDCTEKHFFSSQYILQSFRGHSAIVLTVNVNGMQEIHPVIYLRFLSSVTID
jgi:hypothetical protein